jgi:anti-sigma factor RsiW
MSCSKWVEPISRMIEGSLGDRERRELEGHLAACARCRTEVALQRSIDAALRVEPRSALPADFAQRVAATAVETLREEKASRPWLVLVPPLAAAAALAALFLLGLSVARDDPSAVETLVAGLVKPAAWVSQALAAAAGSAERLLGAETTSATRLFTPTASFVLSTLVGILPAAWGLRRIFVFMKR